MKKLTVLSTVALLGIRLTSVTQAEARHVRHGALAAGVIDGLAVGALVGSAASNAYAAPVYAPTYAPTYSYEYAPAPVYRTTRVVRGFAPLE